MITTDLTQGSRVYYQTSGGWAGGESRRCYAVVVKIHHTMVTIALWNERKSRLDQKRVAVKNLLARTTEFEPLDQHFR